MSESSNASAEPPTRQPLLSDIFNTTFALHQVSPLFVGPGGLTSSRLTGLEQKLRDILVGDVVRGVEVGLGDGSNSAMGGAGVLEAVSISMVSAGGVIATSESALQIALQYENALCLCVLLPLPEATEHASKFNATTGWSALHLPLLLLRMPLALKAIIIDFLSDSFDCRVSPIRLTSMDIVRGWELWARETGVPTTGQLAKDAVLTLSFCLSKHKDLLDLAENEAGESSAANSRATTDAAGTPISTPLGLKTIDVFIPNEDLRGFLLAGTQVTGTAQTVSLDADASNSLGEKTTPFAYNLARYVKHHLALDMSNPAVSIVRIACGGFVLAESRLKLFSTPDSSQDLSSTRHRATLPLLLGDLVMRAAG